MLQLYPYILRVCTVLQFRDLERLRMTQSGELADLLFIEEISPYSSPLNDTTRAFVAGNFRSQRHVVPCM